MSDVFHGERIAQYPEKPDVKYVVTEWRRMGEGIEALDGRKATDADQARIRERTNRPNREFEVDGQLMFACRVCAVEYPHSGGLVLNSCPGCGTSPGFIHRSLERNRLATAR